MNELERMWAEVPPPDEIISAEGRQRLLIAARVEHGSVGPRHSERTARPRPVRFHKWWAFGGLSAGIAAATTVVLIATGGGVQSPRPGRTAAAKPLTARVVLLAAAEKAETVRESGKYWHVKSLSTGSRKLGPKKRPYRMTTHSVYETWATRDARAWEGNKVLPMRPASPADEAAWKADGSPTEWDFGPTDTLTREHRIVYLNGEPGRLTKKSPNLFQIAEEPITYRQLTGLPTEPGALRDWIVSKIVAKDENIPAEADVRRRFLTQCLIDLLVKVPEPPKARAAAFRALAAIPGARLQENVTDKRGHKGVAVIFHMYDEVVGVDRSRMVNLARRLVIDPATAVVLEESSQAQPVQSGKPAKYPVALGTTTYLEVGWTDQKPRVPTGP